MKTNISRREFLNLSTLALGSMFTQKLQSWSRSDNWGGPIGLGRVTAELINVYQEPAFQSTRIKKLHRDTFVWLFDEFSSPHGPIHNPTWYRLREGYAHSAYLQRVDDRCINIPLSSIPETGVLGEISAPIVRSFRYTRSDGWQSLYRLYYHSVHWITGIDEGPNGEVFYRITDHLLYIDYYVKAVHVRPIPLKEYAPISTEVPPEEKRIHISIQEQMLTAYEGDKIMLQSTISSGLQSDNLGEDDIPTDTPVGSFRLITKMPSRHMGDGRLTSDISAYELPGVPWTMIFHETGVGMHGTFWHNNFGTRMSHGCVNMRNDDAKWLFRWTNPVFKPTNFYVRERGTLVQVY